MTQIKKQYVLVGSEAVYLYEQSLKLSGKDAKEEIADLIMNNNADIFIYPDDDFSEDEAFDQFIEQINGWGQITPITKEFVDEINNLL